MTVQFVLSCIALGVGIFSVIMWIILLSTVKRLRLIEKKNGGGPPPLPEREDILPPASVYYQNRVMNSPPGYQNASSRVPNFSAVPYVPPAKTNLLPASTPYIPQPVTIQAPTAYQQYASVKPTTVDPYKFS